MDCAVNLDIEKGLVYDNSNAAGFNPKLCIRNGYTENDFDKPGFASIVTNKEYLS